MLFDDFERTNAAPASYRESQFDFLNRHRSPATEKMRQEIEKWLIRYPAQHRNDLIRRFRTGFESPFFELLLHELFLNQGLEVCVHPSAGTKGKNPDFSVSTPDGATRAIVEATLCSDEPEPPGEKAKKAEIYDAIEDLQSPYCFISIHDVTLKRSKANPKVSAIRRFLAARLAEIDSDSPVLLMRDISQLPRFKYDDDIISIEFGLIPKKREVWGRKDCRNIGIMTGGSRWGNGQDSLRKCLHDKAGHYGQLNEPFVIAVNTLSSFGCDREDHIEALFGSRQEYVPLGTGASQVRYLDNGFWGTASYPKHTRISAVILGCALPWNVPRIPFLLYRNPWAQYPLPPELWKLPQWDITSEMDLDQFDNSVGDILGLPFDWPGDLFPHRHATVADDSTQDSLVL